MKAVVLEETKMLSIRDIDIQEMVGPDDVRIKISRVGICGSDIHYYLHGAIGPYVVRDPMVLGHEASGTLITIFRYANFYPRALSLLGEGQLDIKPLITDVFPFERSISAFEYAAQMEPSSIKVQIEF
jgi:threonine dehydrogenase-like Zn-dependent dehydrogenase